MNPVQLACFIIGWSCVLMFGGIAGYSALNQIGQYGWWVLPVLISAVATCISVDQTK